MSEETQPTIDSVVEPQAEAALIAPPAPEPRNLAPRARYGSFYEAWANVQDLRKFTQRHGVARLGLSAEGQAKAQALIDEYRQG